jgi:hypothetical protein
MEPKVYSSYEEIDRDLEILKLQKEIDTRKLSLTVDKTLDNLTPSGMFQNILGNAGTLITKSGLLKNVVLPFLINKFIK